MSDISPQASPAAEPATPEVPAEPVEAAPSQTEVVTETETSAVPAESTTGDASAPVSAPAEGVTPLPPAFDGYDPDEQAGLLNLIETLRDNPTDAAEMLRNLAAAIDAENGDENPEGGTEGGSEGEGDPSSFTPDTESPKTMREQFDEWAADRDAQIESAKRQTEAVNALDAHIDSLGYGRGEAGKPDPGRAALLTLAHDAFGNEADPIGAAHEAIQAWAQGIRDGAVNLTASKNSVFPPVEGNGGTGSEAGKGKVRTFEDAEDNFRKRL